MNISKRIIELRADSGLSQSALARKAKMPQSTLSYIESGESSPNIIQLEKLCNALGIQLSELFIEALPELPAHMRDLINLAGHLNETQVQLLNKFIKSITEKSTIQDKDYLVAEPLGKYDPIATSGTPNSMDDLPLESLNQVEELKRKRLIKYKKS